MIEIRFGDITKLRDVDVIVNAANKKLMGGMGVDGAIHCAAGPGLMKECIQLGGCEYGEAKLTGAYNIPIKGIIHTVAPIHYDKEWAKNHNYNQDEMLSNCYINSIKLAKKNGFNSIAFPALGCGVYGWKYEDSVKIVFDTIKQIETEIQDMKIIFILFEEEGYNIYNDFYNNYI